VPNIGAEAPLGAVVASDEVEEDVRPETRDEAEKDTAIRAAIFIMFYSLSE